MTSTRRRVMPVAPLVERALGGDQAAWDAIVARYEGLVWMTVRGFRLPEGIAADVAQMTWLRLVERLGGIRNPEALGAWLVVTARRECLAARRRVRPGDDVAAPPGGWEAQDPGPGPDAGLLARERDAALQRALLELPDRCRHLLLMLVADDEPGYRDIAAALDMPVGSIGPTRARCLERLQAGLTRAGATADWLRT